ncbi:hypothetical protein REPUB_Repub05bG0022300 [Reevesia pubescens]
MELCINSTKLLNLNQKTHLYVPKNTVSLSLKNPILQFNKKFQKKPLNYPLKQLSSVSRQIQLLQPKSSIIKASAASSAASGVETDKLPADIKVTETQEPNSRVRLSVEVPSAVSADCYKRVLKEFMKQVKIPGFRPGKIPESILLNYVGEENVQKATVESILKRTLPHAMSSVTGRALRDSVRIITKFSEMEKTFSALNSLSYDVIVDVAPEVKWIPENGYKNLKIVVEIDNEIEAERACEQEIRRRHKSLGSLRIISDRGLQVGDLAVLDISATTIDQDESNVQKIPAAESKGFHFDTEDGDKGLPGFVDSIIGIQRGETKSFPLVFPESWQQENLRGVQAQFNVECKELFYRDLPELNDYIADKLLPGCTDLNQVKESLLQKCREVEQAARDEATDNAILDQLCKMVEIDIPQSLFEEQGRQFYGAKLLEIQIKQNLAVGDIFKRENLQFSSDELVKEVQNSIAEFKHHKQKYDEERVREQVQDVLEGAKVLEWLKEHAEIQYVTR